jgi:hypothetical protein
MTLEAKATILWILAVGLAVVLQILPRSRVSTNANVARRLPGLISVSLAGVALALVVVGVVSGTVRIHLVQISPIVLLFALLPGGRPLVSAATAAVLSWWLVTMSGIWLFLLGLSRFLSGRFSTTEILLTVVIGVACLVGLSASRSAETIPLGTRVPTIVFAAGLQSLALWLSYQPIITGR